MIVPEYLRPGDTVAIAAPARKISPEEVAPAVRLLEEAGLTAFYDDRLFAEEHQFAGSDTLRASYMQELLDNPDIKAVWLKEFQAENPGLSLKSAITALGKKHRKEIFGF